MYKKFMDLRLPIRILIMLTMVVMFAFLFGLFVMLLWNWLMPDIFGLPRIDYWHAWGLVLLSHILFKSWGGRHWGPRRHWKRGRLERDVDHGETESASSAEV